MVDVEPVAVGMFRLPFTTLITACNVWSRLVISPTVVKSAPGHTGAFWAASDDGRSADRARPAASRARRGWASTFRRVISMRASLGHRDGAGHGCVKGAGVVEGGARLAR